MVWILLLLAIILEAFLIMQPSGSGPNVAATPPAHSAIRAAAPTTRAAAPTTRAASANHKRRRQPQELRRQPQERLRPPCSHRRVLLPPWFPLLRPNKLPSTPASVRA